MRILAIDPGNEKSALVLYQPDKQLVQLAVDEQNLHILSRAMKYSHDTTPGETLLAVEMVACYGMPVGAEVFDTCVFIGRLLQAWQHESIRVYRKDVKMHLCGNMRAKDTNVRQALIDRFGPGKETAIGGRRCPVCKGHGNRLLRGQQAPCEKCARTGWLVPRGPLYGLSGDMWAALAVAITAAAVHQNGNHTEAAG